MPYVRTRTTKAGSVSTTLVESYRDEAGRPRQRILANLHGEPDPLRALAKLVVKRDGLLEWGGEERAEPSNEGAGFVMVTDRALTKHNRLIAQIARELDAIERDIAAIAQHCTASDDEFQKAQQRYGREHREAIERVMGLAMAQKQARAALRRMET